MSAEAVERRRAGVAGMGGDRFVMLWPVVDTNRPVVELVEEAKADLRVALREVGVVPASSPFFSMSHGKKPELRAELQVRFA
ncbi:hypothetical protein HYQ03_gp60 [Arthrobacter phage Kuleana]|uniref:Uncharacterized protein n=1 Tax=Arthrobacter phage Kuleana TaxID=2653270 RepID=A0A5Q2W8W1_9CAUD|nr:hypothetical protein HYQ03_gp60 [Arthrobacter phage Kuleana]QGH74547.1 hypothetical protein SEA_KULEANA_60 [Arthrobacter phage Kuleana]